MPKDVVHQNKDVLFKILSETYKSKSFKVYGLNLPPVKRLLPTNLPALKLDEKRADNIFLLEDDTILILEYESTVSDKNFLKYANYALRIIESYGKEKIPRVITAVIYTSDIDVAPNFLDTGLIKLKFEQVFLSKFDGVKIYNNIKHKVENKLELTDEDIMQLIILPLTEKNKKQKQKFIENTINLAKDVSDKYKQAFIIAGVLSASDKFIDREYYKKIRRWIKMTNLARLFEEEKEEAIEEAINDKMKQVVRNLLVKDMSIKDIIEVTGLSEEQIKELIKSEK